MPFPTILNLRHGAYVRPSVLRRLALFLVVVLPIVWLFVAHERAQLENVAREESNRNVKNLAHAFAEEVRSSVVTIDLSLSQLRLSWLRNPDHFDAIVTELNSHLHGQMHINFIITDPQGRCCIRTCPVRPGRSISATATTYARI